MALVINKVYNAKDANGKTITSEYALHGMKRDDDGLLTYSKVNWYSGDEIKMDNGEGTAYNSVGSFQKNELEYNTADGQYNVGHNIMIFLLNIILLMTHDKPILNLETTSNTYLMKIKRLTL